MSNTWPPTLEDVKEDAHLPVEGGDPSDTAISTRLAAAIAYVRRVRPTFNYEADPLCKYEPPTDDIWQGTVLLVVRWIARRRSQDGMVFMGSDQGASRIGSVDPDIERMLGIGRYADGAFA